MEINQAVTQLAALAQEHRLAIMRRLIQAGEAGLTVGEIGAPFQLSGATLSFHLKNLKQAGLLECRRDGRSLIYSANYPAMDGLLAYLTENCCGGQDCSVTSSTESCS